MNKEILTMKNITKAFPGVLALDDVTFNCYEGEVHALVGENGAGKSTLMKILSGAHQQNEGSITFLGKKFDHETPHQAQEAGIATIYQEFNLIPHLNIFENIFLGREIVNRGFLNRTLMKKRAKDIMHNLGVDIDMNTQVNLLSVAEQQMVEIAKAVSMEAKLIIMDEPTAALSEHEVGFLFKTILNMKKQGIAVIYISHRLEEIFEVADRVTILKDGKFVETKPVKEVNKDILVRLMVGRELTDFFPGTRGKPGEKVMEVRNLTEEGVLNDISFDVYAGEILGISGLVGAGRTELVRAIFGADQYSSGEIRITGEKVTIRKPIDAINHGIGFVTEDRKNQGLILKLSVRKNLTLPLLKRLSQLNFLKLRKEKQIVEEHIQKLRIKTPSMETIVNSLSGGNQQKVVLAKWLTMNCRIIILDEPTRGIDVGAKAEIYNLMRRLADEGTAIIMISSELPEIIGVSDRILVMHSGRLTAELPVEEATEEKIMWYATGEESHEHAVG